MIYAVSDLNGKWVILDGWMGCQAGQGNMLESDIDPDQVEQKIKEYSKK